MINFLKETVPFILKNCVKQANFFRRQGKEDELKREQRNIDSGLFDFLKVDKCVAWVGPLYKRFLRSFKKSIVPSSISNKMIKTPSKFFEIGIFF